MFHRLKDKLSVEKSHLTKAQKKQPIRLRRGMGTPPNLIWTGV